MSEENSLNLSNVSSTHQACPFYSRLLQECDSNCRRYDEEEIQGEGPPLSDSATKNVKCILNKILKDVFAIVDPPEPPTIKMKKKWMKLNRIIPEFYIDEKLFERMTFRETLLICNFNETNRTFPTPIGGLNLDIQAARGHANPKQRRQFKIDKFLVHLSSQFDFFGHNGGSAITAWVDRNLLTLEERRREYVQLEDGVDEQTIYINSQDHFYYLRHNKSKDIIYTPEKARNLIGEGSNFLLMRYLALTKFVGQFEVSTVYIDGSLCRNIYECKGPFGGLINDKKIDVCKIYRTIIEQCGIEHKCMTLMTLQGQILKQEWLNCDYILQLNPLVDVDNYLKPSGHQRVPLDKFYENDIQMLSYYLDAKTRTKKQIENYMNDHKEIKDMISDYVQTVLQLKPEDVFSFTAKYFLSFTPNLLPQTEYFVQRSNDDDNDTIDDEEFWRFF